MDALVIGKPGGLTTAVVRAMRRRWMDVLQATPADADDAERVNFLLDEAGEPPLVVVFDTAPYPVARELVGRAAVVVVDERRVAAAVPGAVHERAHAQLALFGRKGGQPGRPALARGRRTPRRRRPGTRRGRGAQSL
jgi:hypothetical protein